MLEKDADGLFVKDRNLPPRIREELLKMVTKGFKREHLVLSPSGDVFFDPEACDFDALKRAFPEKPAPTPPSSPEPDARPDNLSE
jgi:hypothetical protein